MFVSPSTSKTMVPVMDLDYDLSRAFHTPDLLERKIRMLAEHGFETLHIVAPPTGNPNYSHAAFVIPADGPPNYFRASRATFPGDPLACAVKYAKAAGLEVIVEFKPYEGGGNLTLPHGVAPAGGRNYMETLGGRAVGIDPFIVAHPEFLLARKPEEEFRGLAVTAIELAWASDAETISALQIFTSEDNGVYTPYAGSWTIDERIEERRLDDANGMAVEPEPVQCRVVRIGGMNLEAPYFAVAIPDVPSKRRSVPGTMTAVFHGERRLPVTVSTCPRRDEREQLLAFTDHGFEFEVSGPALSICGWQPVSLWGFARGKLPHLRGGLCEAYPEVRAYWLEQIERFVEMGADGVDLRLQNHCSGVSDFAAYGFNPPLIDAYRKAFGADILREPYDPIKLMQLRGRFFSQFVKDAQVLLHCRHRKLLMQFHAYLEKPSLSPARQEFGFWANAKILPDWHDLVDLADEIVIKNYNFGAYSSEVADGIKNLAAERGKPLWVHCYLQQGHDWNPHFIQALNQDSRVSGILLYEVVWNRKENDGIIQVDGETIRWRFEQNF